MKNGNHMFWGVIMLCMVSPFIFASEQQKNINVRIGFSSDAGKEEIPFDSAGTATGKIVGTAIISTITGDAMTAGLSVVKNSDALTPVTYAAIAGLLLYSQWHIVKKVFGPTYTDFATWVSTVSMVGLGCGVIILDKRFVDHEKEKKQRV